jgi:hypoxanthine-DNA glycosylase
LRVRSFPPIARADARVLILGSMPGVASLRAGQYYAHPHNAFWRILGEIAGARPDLPYAARTRRLMARKIALWDVMKSCYRPGSGDSEIHEDSIVPNNFKAFFAAHPRIRRVYFNGTKAEQTFRRYVLPRLGAKADEIEFERLPSTSPAHAGCSYQQKLAAWRAALTTPLPDSCESGRRTRSR